MTEETFAEEIVDEVEVSEEEFARLSAALQGFGVRLSKLAIEQVKAKSDIERRWLQDLRAYYGKYDDATLKAIESNSGSKVYVNITRHKSNTAEARLVDMLFPSDDKNWSITSTPNPELVLAAKDKASEEGLSALDVIEKASDAATAMEREINDQLVEADYAARCRDSIHDCVMLGTGIIKSPVVEGRVKKSWLRGDDDITRLKAVSSLEPGVEVVSPWDYFPDMSARNKYEVGFEFERKFLNKKQVKALLEMPGVLEDQVLEVLRNDEPEQTQDDTFGELRRLTGDSVNVTRSRYLLWEYHGEIESHELESVGVEDELGIGMNGTVLILNGKVIKASLNPLDTEDSPYAVFNWEVDSNSLFGFGVPYLIKSPQDMINAATRMMLDNAKLTVAPQIVVNKKYVTPANNDWTFAPFKQWYINDDNVKADDVIKFIHVTSNQPELSNIYAMARTLIDEQSSLPAAATGEGDPNAAPQTATGVSITSGAAKIVFKRVVKNFDDDCTAPTIKKFYAFNMQYGLDESIKGDMQIKAIGSSTLMVREQEAALMGDVLGMLDSKNIQERVKSDVALTEFFKSRGISTNKILRTDEEVAKYREEEQQSQQGQQHPQMIVMQAKLQIEQSRLQQKESEMQIGLQKWEYEAQQKEIATDKAFELELIKLAEKREITVEELRQKSVAMEMKATLDQGKEQNRVQIENMRLETTRQIAAINAQQAANKLSLQGMNLRSGYDTF